jgi:hypothetical protein
MFSLTQLRWVLLAAGSGWACHLAVHHPTPIDAALPLLGVVIVLLAAVSHGVIVVAVPLLVVAELALPDEATRLLAIGAVLAASFVAATVLRPRRVYEVSESETFVWQERAAAPLIAITALILLRWIPLAGVQPVRELALLAAAGLIVVVLGRTPFAIAVAVVAALVTPAVPLRTLALPLVVLLVAVFTRKLGMPAVSLTWPSSIVLAFAILFFAWSGVVARGFPWFLREMKPAVNVQMVGRALPPGESSVLAVPDGAQSLVVSGANVPRLQRGALLGTIEPGAIEIRIGDAADWGYMRREQFYGSRNPLPRDSAGILRGYGQQAWVDGAGRIALPPGVDSIRITADRHLPEGATLQVERFELTAR